MVSLEVIPDRYKGKADEFVAVFRRPDQTYFATLPETEEKASKRSQDPNTRSKVICRFPGVNMRFYLDLEKFLDQKRGILTREEIEKQLGIPDKE